MAAPILVTKLFIPPTRAARVQRPDLIERLNDGLDRKLTLLSTPAGFGKTTLVSHWVENMREDGEILSRHIQVAWLSLDGDDNDPVRFLTYFIAALNQSKVDIGQGALSMLQSPQPPPATTILISLINDLAAIPDKIVFVLDDYHLIESKEIHQVLIFLLENLPPRLHLVIATRQDPPLSLGRLRARNHVTELRAADLRFTSSEAADFLNRVMGLNISSEDIAELETRTEGWIAGLQMAALSMQRRKDRKSFIKSFTGGHRLVLDFLIEEVLDQQPEGTQNFLLQTAILDRMTGSLCDAVRSTGTALSGTENSQDILEMLDHANLFIVPLDEERRWYRYHHLFADLLRQRLRRTQPDQLKALQRRASEWYQKNGFIDEAIEYALRAEDFEQASPLIEEVAEALWVSVKNTRLQRWLAGLPDDLIYSKPKLCVFHAWLLLSAGQQDAAERNLLVAEQALGLSTDSTAETSSIEWGSGRMKLLGRIAVTRAFLAFFRGDMPRIIQYARQALDILPEQDLTWRSTAAIALGDAHSINGDSPAAYQARLKALEASKAAGNTYMYLVASIKMAITLRQQGCLQQVTEICQQDLLLARESGLSRTAVVGSLFAVWGEVLAEFNDLDEAIKITGKGVELTEREGDLGLFGWSNLCWIRVLYSSGNMIGAEKVIREMNSIARKHDLPPWIMNLLLAWRARLWLAQGKLEAASQWAEDRGLDAGGAIEILQEPEYIILARILTAQSRLDEARRLLQRMSAAAESGGRISRMIEICILQAFTFQAMGDTTETVIALEQALTLAEPSGFIRIFVDEGPPMAQLLYEALNQGIAPEYVQRLLAAFPVIAPQKIASTKAPVDQSGLIEPLSVREIEVLQLLAKGLSNQVIATRLVLSPHTIKTHTRNIYGKLAVNNRTQAIDKARTLGILSPN